MATQTRPTADPTPVPRSGAWLLRAVLTDVQFWVPLLVLLAGLALLVALH